MSDNSYKSKYYMSEVESILDSVKNKVDKNEMPTKVSEFENDSDFATESYADTKANEAETAAKNYTNQEVDTCLEASKQYADKADKIKFERQKYYGDPDVVPSDESWFTVNDTGETITGVTTTGAAQSELVIPYEINGVKITTIGISAFEARNLTGIIIPSSVKTIEYEAFRGCSGLTSIIIPDSVTSIGNGAFRNCGNLTSVIISNSVESIGKNLFAYTSLKSVNIPKSVKTIVNFSFGNCLSLVSVEIPNSVTSIDSEAFDSTENMVICCKQGSYAETYAKGKSIPIMYTDVKASAIDSKVDKEAGKGLSTEDYTTEEKTKLSKLPTNAELDADMETLLADAKIYADSKANDAYSAALEVSRNNWNLHDKPYIDETAQTAETTAKAYADEKTAAAQANAQTYANTAEQNAKNYVDGRLDKEFELLAEVEITETGISNVTVKKDQNNQALRLKKIFVDCTLAPIDDNEEGSTTYQSGQFSVALFLDNSNSWSFWSLTNAAWKVGTTNYVPLYYWIENKKPMGVMCTATPATYNAAAMGFPVNASRYSEAAEVITGISLNVGSSTLPDMPVGTKFKVWGVKE